MATKRKRKGKNSQRKKTNSTNYTLNILGLLLVFVSILAGLKCGLVGRFLATCYRIVAGNGFQVLAIILFIFGILLFLLGKMPALGFKFYLGFLLLAISILTIMQALLFQKLALNNDILGVSWRLLLSDLHNNQVATDVGGGMLGALLFSIFKPLFSLLGTFLISSL